MQGRFKYLTRSQNTESSSLMLIVSYIETASMESCVLIVGESALCGGTDTQVSTTSNMDLDI